MKSWPIPWDYEVPPSSPKLIVERGEYDLLVTTFTDAGIKPEDVEEVLLVSGYLGRATSLVSFLSTRGADDFSGPSDALTDLVAGLCRALRDYSQPSSELHAMWGVLKSRTLELGAFEKPIAMLLDYYAEMEDAYLACAVVDVAVANTRRPAWWKGKPNVVARMERWRKALAFEMEHGRPVEGFLNKTILMLSALRGLEKSHAKRTSDVFVSASAFCYCCAEIQYRRGCSGVSLMMLNRATEFILTAVALDAGVASVGSDNVTLVNGEAVGVSSLLRLLVGAGKISSSLLAGHAFGAVNTSRNQLGYTHGLAQVSADDVSKALTDIRLEIKGLDPSLGWWAKVKDMHPELTDSSGLVAAALEYDRLVERVDSKMLRAQMDALKG